LQVLVIAELVGTAYYRLLHKRSSDPVLKQACDRILRDEARHIDFHADWLGDLGRLLLERATWSAQFQVLFSVAAQVAWMDHRRCLRAIGESDANFSAKRTASAFISSNNSTRAAEGIKPSAARAVF
jgi:hypothetical protein